MRSLNVELTRWEAQRILDALTEPDAKGAKICQTSLVEGEIAGYGNDLIELRLTLKSLNAQVIEAYGPRVPSFSREQL